MTEHLEDILFEFSNEIYKHLVESMIDEINLLSPGTLSPQFIKCATGVIATRIKMEMFDKIRDREWMESLSKKLTDEHH